MLRRATNNEVFGKNKQSRNVTAGAQTQAEASKGSISNFQKRQVAAATGGEGMDMAAKWDPFGANHYSEETNPWAGFFGQPAHPWKTSSYQKYDRSNYNLPEAYEGNSIRLQQNVDELIYLEESFYTTALAPYVFTDQISVSWDKWTFNQHFTGVVPEQGVSRLVSSRRETRQESFVRRGLGLILEHGFMSSPGGREHYFLSLAQIARAVVETINFGVIYAYLTCQNYAKQYEQRHGFYRTRTLRDLLEREKFMWAIAVKEKNGMEKLDAQIVEWMDLYDGVADSWLLTPKTAVYLRLVPSHKTDYNIAGPMGPARVNDMAGPGRPRERNAKRLHDMAEPYALYKNYNVWLTRSYNVETTGPIDLMSQVSSVGEFFKIVKPSSAPDYNKEWTSKFTNTRIYDEDNNCGYTVTKSMGIIHSQVFDEDGEPRQLTGSNLDPADGKDLDGIFFLRKTEDEINRGATTYLPIQYMGDINPVFCETGDVANIAQATIASVFAKAERVKYGDALTNGLLLVKAMASTPIVAGTTLSPAIATATEIRAAAVADLGGWITWDAVTKIASSGNPLVGAALQSFVNAVQEVSNRISVVYGNQRNFLLDPKNAVSSKAGVPAVLYENVLFPGQTNLFAAGGAGTASNVASADAAVSKVLRKSLGLLLQAYLDPGADAAEVAARKNSAADIQALTAERSAVSALIAKGGNVNQTEYDARRAVFVSRLDSWVAGADRAARMQWVRNFDEDLSGAVKEASQVRRVTEFSSTASDVASGLAIVRGTPVPAGFLAASRYNPAAPSTTQYESAAAGGETQFLSNIGIELMDMPIIAALQGAQLAGVDGLDERLATGKGAPTFSRVGRSMGSGGYMDEQQNEEEYIGRMMTGADSDFNPRNNSAYGRQQAARQRSELEATRMFVPRVGDLLARGEAINLRFGVMAKNVQLLSESQSDPLVRLVGMVYLAAPWRRQTLLDMEAKNIPAPVGILGFRVGMYDMAIGIKVQAGKDTAFTAFGNSSFMLSDDAVLKVHYGNYTHYSKTIVREEKNVFVAYNIFPNRALGGMGVTPYKSPEQFIPGEDVMLADIFYVMIPYTETEFSQVISMAGRFYTYMDAGMIDSEDPSTRELHYTTAPYYNRVWGWYSSETVVASPDDPLYQNRGGAFRLEVWQGAQGSFNPDSKKYDRDIIPNTSPWGVTAIGSRAVRNGEMAEMPVVPIGVLGF